MRVRVTLRVVVVHAGYVGRDGTWGTSHSLGEYQGAQEKKNILDGYKGKASEGRQEEGNRREERET